MQKTVSNPSFPYSKFFTGNKQTLTSNSFNNNADIRSALLKFHDTYYRCDHPLISESHVAFFTVLL